MTHGWDREVDVVVVGSGYAGGVASIAAHDGGARVMVFEKMGHPGGNSILSGGFFTITDDVEGAFAYLERMCLNTVPDDVIHAFAGELHKLGGFMRELTDGSGVAAQERHRTGGTYRFAEGSPGDAMGLPAAKTEEPLCYPWLQAHGTGWVASEVVDENVTRREIEVPLSKPVERLVAEDGRVVGIVASVAGATLPVRASASGRCLMRIRILVTFRNRSRITGASEESSHAHTRTDQGV